MDFLKQEQGNIVSESDENVVVVGMGEHPQEVL